MPNIIPNKVIIAHKTYIRIFIIILRHKIVKHSLRMKFNMMKIIQKKKKNAIF